MADTNSGSEVDVGYIQGENRLDKLLNYLDAMRMTSKIKQETQLEPSLNLINATPGFHFPKEYADRAKTLQEKWVAQNWGQPTIVRVEGATVKREGENELMSDPKRLKLPSKHKSTNESTVDERDPKTTWYYPPANHLIWGDDGIMHGLAIKKKGTTKSKALDPRYKDAKVDYSYYGDNGLEVGHWFPMRLSALFQGAHGASQAGISGSTTTGAYSVVASGHYDNLDKDRGDVLWYTGSNSHDNTDSSTAKESSAGTKCLHASLLTQNPVRVIRGFSSNSMYRPSYGYRYDGLYVVETVGSGKNERGGRTEQFKLVRMGDQDEIKRFRPNPKEIRDYKDIDKRIMGFPPL